MTKNKAKYYIYFNRHKELWSIKHKGTIWKYTKACWFPKANTVIHAKTQHRAQQTGIRNVHAFIASTSQPVSKELKDFSKYKKIYYTPFAASYFSVYEDGEYKEVKRLENIYFTTDGQVFCENYF